MEQQIEAFILGYIFCLIVIVLWKKFISNNYDNN